MPASLNHVGGFDRGVIETVKDWADKLLISIVDDDESVRKALRRLFSSLDMTAETFDSGQAFLDSLAARRPDCLILDLHMPGINGFDVIQQLSRTGARVPTIIITAYDEPDMQRFAHSALAYLRKPIDEQVLLSAIKGVTGNKAQRRPA